MRRIAHLVAILVLSIIISSCASAPKEFDWEAVPLMFDAEILNNDFPGLVVELVPHGRIGRGNWNFDPEEPRYIAATSNSFYLFDRFSGTLFSLDLENARASELLKVQKGEEKYIVGLDADSEGDVLAYSQEKFYLSGESEPITNLVSAESVAVSADSIFAVNNPEYSEIEGQVFVELDKTGKAKRTFGKYVQASDDRLEKTRPQIRAHGDLVAIWKGDYPKITLLNIESGEERTFDLKHLILDKRNLINSGEYFKDLKGRASSMFMPVYADMVFNSSGLFALLSNDGLGVIIQISFSGEIENIFTFPLKGSAIALDLAVLAKESGNVFGVIVARGQKLSAYLFAAPATHD